MWNDILSVWKYRIDAVSIAPYARNLSQTIREHVVVWVLNYDIWHITLSSIEKLSWLDLLCLFTWLPPNEVLRYTGEFDVTDRTYALRFLRAYIWQKEAVYESLKSKWSTYTQSTWWNGKIELREPMAAQVEYRKIRSLEMIEDIIKNGLDKCSQEATETSIFLRSRERQSQIFLKWLEDIKKDRIFLQNLLIAITDLYYPEGL